MLPILCNLRSNRSCIVQLMWFYTIFFSVFNVQQYFFRVHPQVSIIIVYEYDLIKYLRMRRRAQQLSFFGRTKDAYTYTLCLLLLRVVKPKNPRARGIPPRLCEIHYIIIHSRNAYNNNNMYSNFFPYTRRRVVCRITIVT